MTGGGEFELLGAGSEGTVHRVGPDVVKTFRPGIPADGHVSWLERTLPRLTAHLPGPCTWAKAGGVWQVRYPWERTEPVERLERDPLVRFLRFCIRERITCPNFKLANFRCRRGELFHVDLGEWVLPFRIAFFRDMCARAFLQLGGMGDAELAAHTAGLRQPGALESIPGFEPFYRDVVLGEAARFLESAPPLAIAAAEATAGDVTLLVKTCAMDAAHIAEQLVHLTGQLGRPRRFREVLVAVDPWDGPFLRSHGTPDVRALLEALAALKQDGVIDRILVSPRDRTEVSALCQRWFGVGCAETHTRSGVPVQPQLWAFDQVRTRWVLQADADVLVGRRDLAHDYLAEMLRAIAPSDIVGVAFNIPFPAAAGFRPYDAPPGSYVPEVRCGLLDLERLTSLLPLPNAVVDGKLDLTWYRSLEREQRRRGLRFVRGGDSRTYYLHPPNTLKRVPGLLDRVRHLVEQDMLPREQLGRWDALEDPAEWELPCRPEDLVFLVMGGDIPRWKVERCFRSLLAQDRRDFGVLVVDDGSNPVHAYRVRELARALGARATIVSRRIRQGRLANKAAYVRALIPRHETLVAVLDMDDCLMNAGAAGVLLDLQRTGVDVAIGGSFRPDKPLKSYPLDVQQAAAHRGAGNVWVHLRCFTRRAFDTLSDDDLKVAGAWIPDCSDYATMVPIVRRTRTAVAIEDLLHLHERSTPTTPELRRHRNRIIDEVLRRNRE